MKYIRGNHPFSLLNLLDQLVEWVKNNGKPPKYIILPPEEYIYINYLNPGHDFSIQMTEFLDVPLKVNNEDEQTEKFYY